tara:strand:+ start:292 stop:585 length:294 start_codon:yes stop_codon:yes gene_type:complete
MSLDTCIRIEQTLGIGIIKLGNLLANTDITLTQIIQVITLAIRGGGNDVKEKDIKKLISDIGLIEAIKITGELVALALNVDDNTETDDEKKSDKESS